MNNISIKNKEIGAGRPKVCVPLVGRNDKEILNQVEKIVELSRKTTIDIVELRGDFYEGLNQLNSLESLMRQVYDKLGNIILLFTIRSSSEGGEALAFDTPSIEEINNYVISNRLADMVDVELFSGEAAERLVKLSKTTGVRIIMSNHDFTSTPDTETMVARLCQMQEIGADIAKIAVMPQDKQHVIKLLSALETMNNGLAKVPIVGISMGKLGAISRVSGEVFGSAITFAALDKASAPGQIPVQDINCILDSIGKYC